MLLCIVAGRAGGLLARSRPGWCTPPRTRFARLPFHWMWWPAIGGLIIGLGGLIEPRALGVGYDVIDQLLTGRAGMSLIVGILVVKTLIWSLSLGSGTSGGVLAPRVHDRRRARRARGPGPAAPPGSGRWSGWPRWSAA